MARADATWAFVWLICVLRLRQLGVQLADLDDVFVVLLTQDGDLLAIGLDLVGQLGGFGLGADDKESAEALWKAGRTAPATRATVEQLSSTTAKGRSVPRRSRAVGGGPERVTTEAMSSKATYP